MVFCINLCFDCLRISKQLFVCHWKLTGSFPWKREKNRKRQSPEKFYFSPVLPPAFTLTHPIHQTPPHSHIQETRDPARSPFCFRESGPQGCCVMGQLWRESHCSRAELYCGGEGTATKTKNTRGRSWEGGRTRCLSYFCKEAPLVLPQECSVLRWDTGVIACWAAKFITMI